MKKLLLTFTAILASIAHAADGPKETAQTFFHELFAGDADKAAELIYLSPEVIQESAQHKASMKPCSRTRLSSSSR